MQKGEKNPTSDRLYKIRYMKMNKTNELTQILNLQCRFKEKKRKRLLSQEIAKTGRSP